MICHTALSNLGYECHTVADDLVCITTPFMQDDGSAIQAYIEQRADDEFIITDDANTFWTMDSRGITLSPSRIATVKQTLKKYGVDLNARAEIITTSNNANLSNALQRVIQGIILTDTLGLDWYKRPQDNFELSVKSTFKATQFQQTLSFDQKITGLSGHQIEIPIMLSGAERHTKRIFTTKIVENRSWASAYGVLGKIMDLHNPIEPSSDKTFIVIDDEAIGQQLNQLVLLFNQSNAKILPFRKRDIWLEQLAA